MGNYLPCNFLIGFINVRTAERPTVLYIKTVSTVLQMKTAITSKQEQKHDKKEMERRTERKYLQS